MDDQPADPLGPKPNKRPEPVVPSLDHLMHTGPGPTPEQVAKEHARRKGRHRKDWWKASE